MHGAFQERAGGQTLQTRRDDISILHSLIAIMRYRRLVVGIMISVFVLAMAIGFLRQRTFSAHASFIPQHQDARGGLSGLAAQFGLSVPGTELTQSSAFYVDLLMTRPIERAVVENRYNLVSDTGRVTGTLVELFGIKGPSAAEKLDAAVKRLRASMSASVVERTGVINVSVKAPYASLAAQIVQQLLNELNRFNVERRRSQASAEREFIETRLGEINGELRSAEERLQTFLQRNRDYRNSPELVFQEDRLVRDVSVRQQLFTTVSQAYEQARIEEVRDTPVITVVEPPEVPLWPDSRRLTLLGVLALAIGAMLGAFLAFLSEFARRTVALDSDEFEQFAVLRAASTDDLRHPWRALRDSLGWTSRKPRSP